MQALKGYKCYIVAFVAALYAWVGFFFGAPPPSPIPPVELADAIKLTLAAAALVGLRSGIASEIRLLLAGLGINVPNTANMGVKLAAVANQAKKAAPAIALCFLFLGAGMLQACAVIGGQDPRAILTETEVAFSVAEATYDSICSINRPPSFCTDPGAQRAYIDAKLALEAAFQTADAAISASNGLDTAAIDNLLQAITNDWMAYQQIVNATKAHAIAAGIAVR